MRPEDTGPPIRGQRPPHLAVTKGHNIFEVTGPHIRGQGPPQFLVPEGHKILEVSDDYVTCQRSLIGRAVTVSSYQYTDNFKISYRPGTLIYLIRKPLSMDQVPDLG